MGAVLTSTGHLFPSQAPGGFFSVALYQAIVAVHGNGLKLRCR